jgi:hypothetical protein
MFNIKMDYHPFLSDPKEQPHSMMATFINIYVELEGVYNTEQTKLYMSLF